MFRIIDGVMQLLYQKKKDTLFVQHILTPKIDFHVNFSYVRLEKLHKNHEFYKRKML